MGWFLWSLFLFACTFAITLAWLRKGPPASPRKRGPRHPIYYIGDDYISAQIDARRRTQADDEFGA